MRRRSVLALLVTGLGGCAGSEERISESETQPTKTPTSTTSPTATPVPATFELIEFNAPETAEIDEQAEFTFTVKNTGEVSGDFSTTVSYRTPGEGWETVSNPFAATIKPGETHTFDSGYISSKYLQKQSIRLDAFGAVRTIQFLSAKYPWGGIHEVFNGTTARVDYVEFSQQLGRYTASQGRKFATARVVAENTSGEIATLVSPRNFVVLNGDSQYDYAGDFETSLEYRGGEVQPGVVRKGIVAFEVPSDVSVDALEVVWGRDFSEGDIAVYWKKSGYDN